jgi:drug/metabolite transporter (DMT)-like permease
MQWVVSRQPAYVTSLPAGAAMGLREWSLLLFLSVLWGASFFFFKELVSELPTLTIVLARLGLAAILLNAVVMARGGSMPRDAKRWREFFVMGLLNNALPFVILVWSETQISSGLAAILNATTPVFSVLIAHFYTADERLTWSKGFGVFFGLLGVLVLLGPSMLMNVGGAELLPELACVFTALVYAVAGIYGRRFKDLPALNVATGQLTASAAILLPLALIIDHPWSLPNPSWHAWQAIIGLAVFSTALAYIIYFRLLASAGPTNVLLVTLLVPISAVLLGVLFLKEAFTVQTFAGMALIAAGLAAIDGRLPNAIGEQFTRRRA